MKTARHYRGSYQLAALTELARELRAQRTLAENLLWQLLRNRQLQDFKFGASDREGGRFQQPRKEILESLSRSLPVAVL